LEHMGSLGRQILIKEILDGYGTVLAAFLQGCEQHFLFQVRIHKGNKQIVSLIV